MSKQADNTLELAVTAKGEITASNFDKFRELAVAGIEAINFAPKTDEEFGQAELDIKKLKGFESSLSDKKNEVLTQMDEVYKLITGMDKLSKLSADNRKRLKNCVDAQKLKIREDIEQEAAAIVSISHPNALPRIRAAMKNKRTLASLRDSATEAAETIEKEVQTAIALVDSYAEKHGDSVIYDKGKLLLLSPEMIEVELDRRVERQKQEEEKARLRLEAEAEKKKADALAAEQAAERAKAQAEAVAEVKEPEHKPLPAQQAPVATDTDTHTEAAEAPTAAQELAHYCGLIKSAFVPVKAARANLTDPENIAKAKAFAITVGEAWKTLNAK